MTGFDLAAGHVDCHDESTCPLTLLFGHPGFIRAYLKLTADENWPPKRLAELVLDLLEAGPLSVTDDIRARVNTCPDPEVLRVWARRALRVTDPEDLFVDDKD